MTEPRGNSEVSEATSHPQLKVGMLDSGFTPDILSDCCFQYGEVSHAGYELDEEAAPADGSGHGSFNLALFRHALDDQSIPMPEFCLCRSVGGGHVISRLLTGLDWLVSKGSNVINIPAGIRGYTPVFLAAVNTIRESGAIPVVSVGNDGPGAYRSPGCYPNVLSVGAHDKDLAPTPFSGSCYDSGFLSKPDILAPGYQMSCYTLPGYSGASFSGTSQSASLVTASIAALLHEFPEIPPAIIEEVLCESAHPLLEGRHRSRRGAVNLPQARIDLQRMHDRLRQEVQLSGYTGYKRTNRVLPLPSYVDPRLVNAQTEWSEEQPLDLVLVYNNAEEIEPSLAVLIEEVDILRYTVLGFINTVLIQVDTGSLDRVLNMPGVRIISLGCDWQFGTVSPWL